MTAGAVTEAEAGIEVVGTAQAAESAETQDISKVVENVDASTASDRVDASAAVARMDGSTAARVDSATAATAATSTSTNSVAGAGTDQAVASTSSRGETGAGVFPVPAPPNPAAAHAPPSQNNQPPRRAKIPLEKGYSQMDWLKLTRSGADLSGLGKGSPRKGISMEEVRQHKVKEDAWMVLHGKVYNITSYLKFHPGGVDILASVAGKDGTAVFNKYHPWVATDALLQKCLVGWLELKP